MPVVVPGTPVATTTLGTAGNPSVSSFARWTLDVDEICRAAADRVTGSAQTKGYELKSARRALQFVFQRLMLRGVNLWTVDLKTIDLAASQTLPIALGDDTIDMLETVARDTNQTTASDIPLGRMARGEYQNLPDKTTSGFPTNFYLDRERDAPELYVWPVPDKAGYQLRYYAIQKMRDVDTMVDNVDAPVRWLPCITAGVAWYMSLDRQAGVDIAERQEFERMFNDEFMEAASEDRDNVPVRVVADMSAYARR